MDAPAAAQTHTNANDPLVLPRLQPSWLVPMNEANMPSFASALMQRSSSSLSEGHRARQWWWQKITSLSKHATTGQCIKDIPRGRDNPAFAKRVGFMTDVQFIKMMRDPVLSKAFLGFSYDALGPAARREFPRRVAGVFMAGCKLRSCHTWYEPFTQTAHFSAHCTGSRHIAHTNAKLGILKAVTRRVGTRR